jgi:DNA (cytosine-5)-methyltransferase 1
VIWERCAPRRALPSLTQCIHREELELAAYYNEIDKFAAQWLRELIKAGLIADGEVDERDIRDVRADDLKGFTQCHFFAGIGGWSYALRLAGWPDDRPVWTGSCPCQPYSVASVGHGGAQGQGDDRHLWPTWFPLIEESRPSVVFGEQVAAAIKWGWWDEAAMDLERAAYACAAAVLRADAIGLEHERKRLYWVADAGGAGLQGPGNDTSILWRNEKALAVNGDAIARARRALAGDYSGLLSGDGVSVVMERNALKGYGNAVVPKNAQVFIEAYLDSQG